MRKLVLALPSLLAIVVLSAAFVIFTPSLALADGIGGIGAFASDVFNTPFSTAGIVALCSAIASVALACSKFLPGWATKCNIVVIVSTAVGGAVGALGPTAGAITIIVAAFGAILGYMRSEKRAAGTPIGNERIAELRAG